MAKLSQWRRTGCRLGGKTVAKSAHVFKKRLFEEVPLVLVAPLSTRTHSHLMSLKLKLIIFGFCHHFCFLLNFSV